MLQQETNLLKLPKTNPLSRRLEAVLNTSLDDPESQEALLAISDLFDLKPTTREIRHDADNQMYKLNDDFLHAFGAVNTQVQVLGSAIQDLENQVQDMQDTLQKAVNDTKYIIGITQELNTKSVDAKKNREIVTLFLERFTLTEQEIRILSNSNESLGPAFFQALEHLQQIHQDCKSLLGAEHQRAGLEIMDSMNAYQEAAYERLFKWTQGECRMMRNEFPEISNEFRQAMHAFRLRPILFDACIEEISTIRSSSLAKAFHTALSVGGQGGFPKPIEFHAHDTIRYTGDILAWIHQICMGEREMLENIFGLASTLDKRKRAVEIPNALQGVEGYNTTVEELLRVLDKNTESLCSMLKKRLDATFSTTVGCVTAYKVVNMLQFYLNTLKKVVGTDSSLFKTMQELLSLANEMFEENLKTHTSDILRSVPQPLSSLEPPVIVRECLVQLKEILVSYDMSLVTGADSSISLIYNSYLDPMIQIINQSSQELGSLERAIFKVNSLYLIQSSLAAFSFTDSDIKTDVLDDLIAREIMALVQEQFESMLRISGLSNLLEALKSLPKPLSQHAQTSPGAVSNAMANFDRFLLGITMDVTESLYRIQSLDIAKRVSQQGSLLFLNAYRSIIKDIDDPSNNYPPDLPKRTVQEVETLLSLNDLE